MNGFSVIRIFTVISKGYLAITSLIVPFLIVKSCYKNIFESDREHFRTSTFSKVIAFIL